MGFMRVFYSLIIGALVVSAAPAFAGDMSGTYAVDGTNIDGSSYSGTANITITSDTTCVINWKTGVSTSQGICMRAANSFAAAYIMGTDVGLVIYKIGADGKLVGTWTIANQPGSGSEIPTPQ
jgi:hypothetical protein